MKEHSRAGLTFDTAQWSGPEKGTLIGTVNYNYIAQLPTRVKGRPWPRRPKVRSSGNKVTGARGIVNKCPNCLLHSSARGRATPWKWTQASFSFARSPIGATQLAIWFWCVPSRSRQSSDRVLCEPMDGRPARRCTSRRLLHVLCSHLDSHATNRADATWLDGTSVALSRSGERERVNIQLK